MVAKQPLPPPAGDPPDRRGRTILRMAVAGLLLLVLLAAGHALLWRWMAGQLEDGLSAWAAARRAQGWQLQYGPVLRGGWPLAATLTLPSFRLAGGAGTVPGGLEWSADALELRLAPPRLDRLVVRARGPQQLRVAGQQLPFAADSLFATLPLERNVLPSEAAVEIVRLRAGTAAGALELGSAQLQLRTRISAAEGEPAVELQLALEELRLPPGAMAGGPGPLIESLGLELALTGPVPLGADPARKAAAWRDGGGTLELRSLAWRWGPVGGNASATIALDEAMQPMGAGTLRLTGAGEALNAAAAAGLLGTRGAGMARAAILLLQRRPAEGEPPQLELPLTLENRQLSAARIPLIRLPAWQWPALPRPPASDAADDPSLPGSN